jgi:hypothetical protein
MLDQGQYAERRRRLALAGVKAALSFADIDKKRFDKAMVQKLAEMQEYLRTLPKNSSYWPSKEPPKIEDTSVFHITEHGSARAEGDYVHG